MLTSVQVRGQLVAALELDLIGPGAEDAEHATEVLPQAPSKWYLTGFLVPHEGAREAGADELGEERLEVDGATGAADDEALTEGVSARRAFFPSSIGLTVLVPAEATTLEVEARWGDYASIEPPGRPESEAPWWHWQRTPRQATRTIQLGGAPPGHVPVEGEGDGADSLGLSFSWRPATQVGDLPAGTRCVSVFLVNRRRPLPDVRRDAAFAAQAELRVRCALPFVARPDVRGRDAGDWDEKVADLQYREVCEYVVGHTVSARAMLGSDGLCREVRTCWLPTAEVEKVVPGLVGPDGSLKLGMETLAQAATPAALQDMLQALPELYAAWIDSQSAALPVGATRRAVAEDLLQRARLAGRRIAAGIELLADPTVFTAFTLANQVMAEAYRQRESQKQARPPSEIAAPAWRPFQLAFVLLNLRGIARPEHGDRKVVDLLFFPTGGGKTEAYLGLAAFTLLLRRLRNPGLQGAGLSVLMRYTLRLLTLDQLGRAATLVCALELLRQKQPDRLGPWPFEIGLWVGQGATPNRLGKKGDGDQHSARARTLAFANDAKRKPAPIPIESCPWCGEKLTTSCFQLLPTTDEPRELRLRCARRGCRFTGNQSLPIQAVDETIYRRLPAFLIATVDKFASLPWIGATGALFGRVERHDAAGFYGPAEPAIGKPLPGPLPPPDLVIQDELHLISGPLGTMVGLYEAAIDRLCRSAEGVRPKIVASTATVRRAHRQIQALFARPQVEIFPPPGPDPRDSFFARTVSPAERNARLYVGVAAPGRSPKVTLLRTYLALLGAAQRAWTEAGGKRNKDNPADPYMTLLGYFNALRELGGSRRIVEDEVNSRLGRYRERRRVGEARGSFDDRQIEDLPLELTSRVSTNQVAEAKRRLELRFDDAEHVDVALATNMISVGLDITRLGLMVVLGQPKMAAEYIQATSRVGRDDHRPGLVVTLLNPHRPRDRSHFERFTAWHAQFYRAVEATSVTPFSPPALDRGLPAVTVALARHLDRVLTPASHARDILIRRPEAVAIADDLGERVEAHDKELGIEAEALRQKVRQLVLELLDAWESVAQENDQNGVGLQYGREQGVAPALLRDPLDPELSRLIEPARRFRAARSLRDVEAAVPLWVRTPEGFPLDGEEEP